MKIIELDSTRFWDVNTANEPFSVIGRVVPDLKNGIWTWREELLSKPWQKQYPNDGCDYSEYIGKRIYTFDGVEFGQPPRELTKIVKCVKCFAYWEFDSIEACGAANGWLFENHSKAIFKLLIMPFEINSGYCL